MQKKREDYGILQRKKRGHCDRAGGKLQVFIEHREAMNAQQIAHGFNNEDHANHHHEHITVEVGEEHNAQIQKKRCAGRNHRQIPAGETKFPQAQGMLDAAEAADHDDKAQNSEQKAHQEGGIHKREDTERRCNDTNDKLEGVSVGSAFHNERNHIEHAVHSDAHADQRAEHSSACIGHEQKNEAQKQIDDGSERKAQLKIAQSGEQRIVYTFHG